MEGRAAMMNSSEAFVDMLAAVTGLPTWRLEDWLEAYFKLRCLECLEPEDAPRAVAAEDTKESLPEGGSGVRMLSAPTEEPKDVCGPSGRPVPTEEPEEIEPAYSAPVKPLSGNGARRKREILKRLQKARSETLRAIDIVRASGGNVREADIYDALACRHLHTSKWEEISAALEKLGY